MNLYDSGTADSYGLLVQTYKSHVLFPYTAAYTNRKTKNIPQ